MSRIEWPRFMNLLCAFALVGCGEGLREVAPKTGSGAEAKLKTADERVVNAFTELLKAEVKYGLKDPDSARFRNVTHYEAHMTFKDGKRIRLGNHTICGEVNAKNSFGGYVGFRPFFAYLIWDDENNRPKTGPRATIYKDGTMSKQEEELLRKGSGNHGVNSSRKHPSTGGLGPT